MLAGNGASIVLQAVSFIVLARLLGAGQYGIFVGAFAFTGIVAQYGGLGTGTVLIRYVSGDHNKFAVYWGNVLAVTVCVGTILAIALQFVGWQLLNPASAALVLLAGISSCLCSQLTAEVGRVFQTFKELRMTAILNTLMSLFRTLAVIAMLLVLGHATAWQWAVISTVVSMLVAVISVCVVTVRFGRPRLSLRMLAEHGMEGIGYSFAASTTSVYNDLDKTMLSHYGMNVANGIYTMAYRIIDVATAPISSIQAAAIPEFFQRGRSSLASAAELSARLMKRASAVSLLISAAMFVTSPLLPMIVGHGFRESASALRWLCLIPVFRSVHVMSGAALTGAGLQRHRTIAQCVAGAMNLGLNIWLIPTHGWRGAAWSSIMTDAALAAMNTALLSILVKKGR
jgi:O-antigen/teichoic acid export membrane protein